MLRNKNMKAGEIKHVFSVSVSGPPGLACPPCLGPENSTSGSSQMVPSACITAVAVVYGRLTRFFPCSS